MSRSLALALILSGTLMASACSADRDRSPVDRSVAAKGSPSQFTVAPNDVASGTDWGEADEEQLDVAFLEEPVNTQGMDIHPDECPDDRNVLVGADEDSAQSAGLMGLSEDGSAELIVAVIKGGRSTQDLREARERCDTVTVETGQEDMTLTVTETIEDGLDIEGATDSFEFDTTWKASAPGRGTGLSIARHGHVAEVRGILVVVTASANEKADGTGLHHLSDEVKDLLPELLEQQVAAVESAH